jgi:xanthine dehydrogenase accessory factor
MKNIYIRFLKELEKGQPLVLATIVATQGSSPQVPGASALFSSEGLLSGTLGGGVLEARAEDKALDSLQSGMSSLAAFGLYADISSEEEAICGGEATILFDAHPQEHEQAFRLLQESLSKRQSGVLVTAIQSIEGATVRLNRSWVEKSRIFGEEAEKKAMPHREETKEAFSGGKPVFSPADRSKEKSPGIVTQEPASRENYLYLEPHSPLPHLVIAGAGHVGQAVAHLGSLLDFEVTVIDDRPEFANKERIPDADHIIVRDIAKAIANLPQTAETYLVIVTRGHSHDSEALKACIRYDMAYIGMIGSARKIGLMRDRFIEKGWATPLQFDRVHAPIGIDIQSKTVQEIAVSITAELVLVRNRIQHMNKEGV